MQVILLEKIRNFGNIGEVVKVKPGFARNFLLPQGKATVANEQNLAKFAKIRTELEQKALDALKVAEQRAEILKKLTFTIAIKATEEGKLFGSVNPREIVEAVKLAGGEINRKEIILPKGPIREIGEHEIYLQLHTDLMFPVKIKVVAEP